MHSSRMQQTNQMSQNSRAVTTRLIVLPMILLIIIYRQLTKAIRLPQTQQIDPEQLLSKRPVTRPQVQTQMPLPTTAIRTLLPLTTRIRVQTAPPQLPQTSQQISPPLTPTTYGESQSLKLSMSRSLCLSLSQPQRKRLTNYRWSSTTTYLTSRCPRKPARATLS